MNSIESLLEKTYSRITRSTALNETGLSFFRIFLGVFSLLFTPRFYWIDAVPRSLFTPPLLSIANLFHTFPPAPTFQVIDWILIFLSFCILLGIKTRISSFLYFLLLVFAESFHFSFGKIDHYVLYTLVYLILALTNSGVYNALIADRPVRKSTQELALSLFGIFICFGMITAGFPKMIAWIDFDLHTSGILSWYYSGFYSLGRQEFLAPYIPYVPLWITEMADYAAVVLEMTGLIFLIHSKRAWQLWLMTLCMFHLCNILILNITFVVHVAVYGLYLISESGKFISSGYRKGIILYASGALGVGIVVTTQFFNLSIPTHEAVISIVLWLILIASTIVLVLNGSKKNNS